MEAFSDVMFVPSEDMETLLSLLERTFIPLQVHGYVTLAQEVRTALERHGRELAGEIAEIEGVSHE